MLIRPTISSAPIRSALLRPRMRGGVQFAWAHGSVEAQRGGLSWIGRAWERGQLASGKIRGTGLMATYPSVDESRDRLHRAGWSVGDVGTASGWLVTGTNGENRIEAYGRGQSEAWWHACEQARDVGMLA